MLSKKFQRLQKIEYRDLTKREKVGLKLPIYIPQLTTLASVSYDYDTSAELKVLRNFPPANQMDIMNTSTYGVKIRLNNSDSSSYIIPANALIVLKNLDYQFFDVQNIGTGTITVNQVLVHVVYEDPLKVRVQ